MNTSRAARSLVVVGLVIAAAACGSGGEEKSKSAPPSPSLVDKSVSSTPSPVDESVSSAVSTLGSVEVTQPSSPPAAVGDLWLSYSSALASAEESEPTQTLEELIAIADAIVVGKIIDVGAGRLFEFAPDSPSSRLQFANFTVEVTRSSGVKGPVSFEVPLLVSSPELDAAIAAAVTPVDANADGVIDDTEAAEGYDAEGVRAAYAEHWDQAVVFSAESARERVPAVETLFFLRSVDTGGQFRLINGDSIIINDGGIASMPLRTVEPTPTSTAIKGTPFESVIAEAFRS